MKSTGNSAFVLILGLCLASSLALPTKQKSLEVIGPPGGSGGDAFSTTSTASPTTTTAPSSGGLLSSILSVFGISHFNDLTINFNGGPANVQPAASSDADTLAGLTPK